MSDTPKDIEAAFKHLLALNKQHKLMKGDRVKICKEHGISYPSKEYDAVAKRVYRTLNDGNIGRGWAGGSKLSTDPMAIYEAETNIHFRNYRYTAREDPSFLLKTLPQRGGSAGWYGFVVDEVTLIAHKHGKVEVYYKGNMKESERALFRELHKLGWSGLQCESFRTSLRQYEEGTPLEKHIAFKDTDADKIPPLTSAENGGVRADVYHDNSPYPNKTIEVKITLTELAENLKNISDMVADLPDGLDQKMGKSTFSILTSILNLNMKTNTAIQKLANAISNKPSECIYTDAFAPMDASSFISKYCI
jgi:hypothetical protein